MGLSKIRAELQIKGKSITGSSIADDTITGDNIAPGALDGDMFIDGSISIEKIEPGTMGVEMFKVPDAPTEGQVLVARAAEVGGLKWEGQDGGLLEVSHDSTLQGKGQVLDQLGLDSTLKATYDGYASQISGKEDAGTASGLVGAHELAYDHTLIATALQSVVADGVTITGTGVTGDPLVAVGGGGGLSFPLAGTADGAIQYGFSGETGDGMAHSGSDLLIESVQNLNITGGKSDDDEGVNIKVGSAKVLSIGVKYDSGLDAPLVTIPVQARYSFGSLGTGKVLTSDAIGNATWDRPPAYKTWESVFVTVTRDGITAYMKLDSLAIVFTTTPGYVQVMMSMSLSFIKIVADINESFASDESLVLTLMKNGVDTALVLAIPGSSTPGVYSATGSIACVVGDLVNIKYEYVKGSGSGTAKNHIAVVAQF